jgi:hypothetical protein
MNSEDSRRSRYPHDADGPAPQRTDVRIRLIPKEDRNGNVYHLARCDAPVFVNLAECTIFIFTGDNPEMSIRRTRDRSGE